MSNSILNVLIGGEAGQGLVTIGNILAKAFVRSGYYIVVTQSYQSRIRGGHNTYAIRVSGSEIHASQESIDILVALDKETGVLHKNELSDNGAIIADEAFGLDDNSIKVPFSKFDTRYVNVLFLGIISGFIKLNEEIVTGILEESLGKKHADVIKQNMEVFNSGRSWINEFAESDCNFSKLSVLETKLMMNGNEAIALGAISAGLKFFSFYPMTPSTSISMSIIQHAKSMGIIYEQAEDEIAAINMALGASFAGAHSMVATSGGGFALMTEGVSLAGMTETPVVIVVAQRPGPATGLPTRTEQGDLEMVLHAGHGEFPRVIYAPGTVEQSFILTRKAFEIAEKFQTPVFILTDQFLADSYRSVNQLDTLSDFNPVREERINLYIKNEYNRFEITESGISPRLIPGISEGLVVADSDEHTEDGHITEDLNTRNKMVEKRLRKYSGIGKEILLPEYQGEKEPDNLFVCWGSSRGALLEVCEYLKKKGGKPAFLHFSQVWPLDQSNFIGFLKSAKCVLSVESNATAQFARLIRGETGFDVHRRILRYDGLPLTPEYILKNLEVFNG